MKRIVSLIFIGIILLTAQGHAEGLGESKFHLFSMKCHSDNDDGPESTPQSPPLDVDDPGTPGCNKWEINVLTDGDLDKDEQRWEMPLLDINYGIGDNFELQYQVPMEQIQSQGQSQSAVGDSSAGIKYLFYGDDEGGPQFAIYPQVKFSTPSSKNANQDPTTQGNIVTVPLLFSKKIGEAKHGDVVLSSNLGYSVSSRPDTRDAVSFALGVGVPLSHILSVMGELSTDQALARNLDNERDQLVKANVGIVGTVNRRFLLYGSVGQSLVASDRYNHTYLLAGFRWIAGGLEK